MLNPFGAMVATGLAASIVLDGGATGTGLPAAGATPVGGKTPRSFAISPDGKVIIVTLQDSSAVTTFAIDSATGKLKQLDLGLELPRPVCVRFF